MPRLTLSTSVAPHMCQWWTIDPYIWLSNLPVGLPGNVNWCLCCPCLSFQRKDIMLHTAVWMCVYVCVFLFVFNKLREVDVRPASSHSLPAWSCWWIVGPSVCVSVCVCVSCYRLRDIRWVLWWIPCGQNLNSTWKSNDSAYVSVCEPTGFVLPSTSNSQMRCQWDLIYTWC